MAVKLLHRSLTNRSLSGVCGGLGEYFSIDPVLVRVAWVLFSISTGIVPGVLAYLVVALIIPEAPSK